MVNNHIVQDGCVLLRGIERKINNNIRKTTEKLSIHLSQTKIHNSLVFYSRFTKVIKTESMASLTRFSLTSSSALCRLLISRNAGLVQQHLPSMIIPSATQQRSIATTSIRRDIDSAAKYIGAGAATVGVAGAGAGLLTLNYDKMIN